MTRDCKECGEALGGTLDYDNFCFDCVVSLMSSVVNDGKPESSNYDEASGEYWREQFKQDAIDIPPFWKTPLLKDNG